MQVAARSGLSVAHPVRFTLPIKPGRESGKERPSSGHVRPGPTHRTIEVLECLRTVPTARCTFLLIAVCGVLFSIWNAQDAASVPCISAGCTLYQSFTVNGFSLWWGGVGIFTLLGLLALTGHAGPGRWLSGLAVLLDCVLLGIMVLTLPCMACMAAALLLALSYAAFRSAASSAETRRVRRVSPLLALWGLLFILNIGGLVRSEIQPWAVQSPPPRTNPWRASSSPPRAAPAANW